MQKFSVATKYKPMLILFLDNDMYKQIKMNQVILRDWYCEKCSLQFDKQYVYDLHLKLVHGQEIKLKTEPTTNEEKFEELQQRKTVLSDHISQKSLQRSPAVGDFYEKYLRFGLVGNTETNNCANYEHLGGAFFSCFQGPKNFFYKKNIVASALKVTLNEAEKRSCS